MKLFYITFFPYFATKWEYLGKFNNATEAANHARKKYRSRYWGVSGLRQIRLENAEIDNF